MARLEAAHLEVVFWSFQNESEHQGEACETGEESQRVNLLEGAPGGDQKRNWVKKGKVGID